MKLPYDLIVYDLETNGADMPDTRITEIGAVRVSQDFRIGNSFSQLVDGRPLTAKSIEVTGITAETLDGKPPFAEAAKMFEAWCLQSKRYLLCAWGTHYDIPVLRMEYRRAGLEYPHRGQGLCIKSLAVFDQWMAGRPAKLASGLGGMMRRYKLAFVGQRHRATDDARATAEVLLEIVKGYDREKERLRSLRANQGRRP